MGAAIFAANDRLEKGKIAMKRNKIQGPALSANIEGLLPAKMQGGTLSANVEGLTSIARTQKLKSVVTGINSAIFLNPSDLAAFNGGQLEKTNSNCHSVGTIRDIFVEKGQLKIRLSEQISGCGHPPSDWEIETNVEFVIDLGDHDFAYIGSGDNGGGSRLFFRSKHYLRGGIQTIRIFPRNGKFIDPLNVTTVSERWSHIRSFTVRPPMQNEESSLFWRRPKPWVQEYEANLSD